jgi:competence protein ComEC
VCLASYVAVVEQRAPVLRAGLMAAIVVIGGFFYRRLELLNSAALAALLLLIANPTLLRDTSFQLSFLAIGCIAGIGVPWIDERLQPYVRALRHWRDVSRDRSYTPRMTQLRLDIRDGMRLCGSIFPANLTTRAQDVTARFVGAGFRIAELFVLSVILQVGMSPLMAGSFHRISLLGPLANLVAVPLVGIIVPLGLFSLATGLIVPPLGRALGYPLAWLVSLQSSAVSWFANLGHSSYRIPGPPGWIALTFFAALIAVALILRLGTSRNRWLFPVTLAFLATTTLVIATYPFRPQATRDALEATVLDVGQGDSILVVSPRGSTLLIDGGGAFQGFRGRQENSGPDPGEDAVSAYLWSRGIRKLDAVALTHAHQDHVGGLTAVLQNFQVSRLLLGRETTAPAMIHLKELAAKLNVPVEYETDRKLFNWDGVEVEILWPHAAPEDVAPLAKNNDSLVVRLRYKERTMLLPGDAEKQVEYTMLNEDDPSALHADVLKVGHHGSKNSTMSEFLSAVNPQIAIISAGDENPYGHPSPELLSRLEDSKVRILRTDQQGAVQILTDGHTIRVNYFVACDPPLVELSRMQAPDDHQRNQ